LRVAAGLAGSSAPRALFFVKRYPMLTSGVPPLALLLLCLPVAACDQSSTQDDTSAAETLPAFGAASGVTRADAGAHDSLPRIIPLGPMSGDAEILYGDPERPGVPFVMRIRELPGTKIPLHSHPVDEHITVVQGTWYFALGERWDSTALQELTTGTYGFAPAGSTMFGYSPGGAVVQIHGVGPFDIAWREGMATLDAADAMTRFDFQRGQRVNSPHGSGTIRQGYASGDIVQYEVTTDAGTLVMVDEQELRRQ
jgi:hypothetical protein